jgi:nitroreductase
MNDVIKTIKSRRMTRRFTEEQLTDEQILEIIDAGQHAPSVQKQQAWNFKIIQNKDLLDEMSREAKIIGSQSPVEVISKLNSQESYHVFYNAPTVILISADSEGMMPEIECIAAAQNIFLAAESMGIGACWISAPSMLFASEKGDEFKKKLNLEEKYVPQLAISLGYTATRPENPYPRKTDRYQFIK